MADDSDTAPLRPAELDGRWIRPAADIRAEPRWGHADGMQVGIPPIPGPRGLLRIFTPYLGHARDRLVNFIAIEPIPRGRTERGYSELEPSRLDPGRRGKRLWTAEDPADRTPRSAVPPARGTVDEDDGVERLTVWVLVEPFDNGAEVHVRVRFRADRPHEVEVAGFAAPGSVPLAHLVLTATMGNWARLRRLELADRVVSPAELWPGFDGTGFAPHARFGLHRLARDGRAAVLVATNDEEDPWSAVHADGTAEHWRFQGKRHRQIWRADDPHPELEAVVNARWAYWASSSEIPGGPAFENVELVEPFRQGAAFRFGVEPLDGPADPYCEYW
ncbi:hypothetical protein [Microbacterium resistens]